MVCRCTRILVQAGASIVPIVFLNIATISVLFVPALSSPVMFPAVSFVSFFLFLFPLSRSAPSRRVVVYPPRFATCAFPKVWAGMTGSDSKGAGHVSQAELATFKQDMANEVAQLQAALQRTVDDTCLLYTSPSPRDRG